MAFRIICRLYFRLYSDYSFELKYLHLPNYGFIVQKEEKSEKIRVDKEKLIKGDFKEILRRF